MDLLQLYKKVFNVSATLLAGNEIENALQKTKNQNFPFPLAKSENEGTPINTQKPLTTITQKTYLTNLKIDELQMPIPPIISWVLQKNIISTSIAGRDFSVKEIIGAEDYRFKIIGFVVSKKTKVTESVFVTNESIDTDFLEKLNKLARINTALKITCPLFYHLGIQYAVIESIKIDDANDYTGVFVYEIQMISDNVPEIEQRFGTI